MQPIRQAPSFLSPSDHTYFKTTEQDHIHTSCSQSLETPTSTAQLHETELQQSIHSKPNTSLQKPPRKKSSNIASLSIPLHVCHIPWSIKTKEERRALMSLQHKNTDSRQERAIHGQALKNALTKLQIRHLIDKSLKKRKAKYYTHRILYICRPRTYTTQHNDPQPIWEQECKSQRLTDLSYLGTKRRRTEVTTYKQRILDVLEEPFLSLFNKIESSSMTFNEYKLIRSHILNLKKTSIYTTRRVFFPGIECVSRPAESQISKALHPAYKLYSSIYLKLTRTKSKSSKVREPRHIAIIKKLKMECCSSLKELEDLTSSIYCVMSPTPFSHLMHNAVRRMEEAGILPTNLSVDFNDPDVIDQHKHSSSNQTLTQQDQTLTQQDQTQESCHKQTARTKYNTPKFPVHLRVIPYKINTPTQRRALLYIQYKQITQQEHDKCIYDLQDTLSYKDIYQLTTHTITEHKYETHRIVYITKQYEQKNPPRPHTAIWNEVFVSHKDDVVLNRHSEPGYEASQQRIRQILDLLSEDLKSLFLKIESYNISFEEYFKLRQYIYNATGAREQLARTTVFPGIVAVNKPTNGPRIMIMHPSYKQAATAYFQITNTKIKHSKVKSEHQQAAIDRLKSYLYPTLTELEKDISMLYKQLHWNTIKSNVSNAIYRMEQHGVLSIDRNHINDPFTQILESQLPIQATQQYTNTASVQTKRKYQDNDIPTTQQTKRTKTFEESDHPSTPPSTSHDWTNQRPDQHDHKNVSEHTKEAAMTLLLLSSYVQPQN